MRGIPNETHTLKCTRAHSVFRFNVKMIIAANAAKVGASGARVAFCVAIVDRVNVVARQRTRMKKLILVRLKKVLCAVTAAIVLLCSFHDFSADS